MRNHKYLIIGGGMTADAAVSGIREIDPTGSIGLISSDSDPPYDRPPLTKALWKGKPLDSVWRHTKDRKRRTRFEVCCSGMSGVRLRLHENSSRPSVPRRAEELKQGLLFPGCKGPASLRP